MKIVKNFILIFLLFQGCTFLSSQEEKNLRVFFYNTENLFDPIDDTLTQDNEFLPDGEKHWTWQRYQDKIEKVYKVIVASGRKEAPDIIGLCEVENKSVLERLFFQTPLVKYPYRIIHQESPDRRGIDVALIFRDDKFRLISKHFFPGYPLPAKTRDVVYVKLESLQHDTLHVFVNHWPSRYGGNLETKKSRCLVAEMLRSKVDSIFYQNSGAGIIILGDMNDGPEDKSITKCLGVNNTDGDYSPGELYNISRAGGKDEIKGSLKYRSRWYLFDQVILSGSLLNQQHSYGFQTFEIFHPAFLLEKDEKYLGEKPFRTFHGHAYHGGFSDHLPVYVDFERE